MSRLNSFVRSISILFLGVCAAWPQASSSSILGLVRDATGAVVPNASIVATQTETGQVFRSVSTSEGYYQFPGLPVGNYSVSVEMTGFKRSVTTGIVLQADEKVRRDIVLEVGSTTESVEVTASAGLVDTTTGTVKNVIDSARMTELPLSGRNMLQLQVLTPGVYGGGGTGGGVQSPNSSFTVNGGRGGTVNYLMDGGDNNDYFGMSAGSYPNPDAVQEFSIQTNGFSAEYGQSSGGVVNVITRAGTNQIHGSVFEFLRNDALNTRNFFSITKPMLRQNQFGASFGGPVVLPKLYSGRNRTFFFAAYQGTRIRSAPTFSNVFVPTAAERRGDFSQSLRKPSDPLTGQRFAGDQIPSSRLDPVAQRFMEQFVPLPTGANGQLVMNNRQSDDADQGILRGDHSFTDNHKIFVRTFHQVQLVSIPDQLPAFRNRNEWRSWNISVGDTWVIRPTLVHSLNITTNRFRAMPGIETPFRWNQVGANVPLAGPASEPTNTRMTVTSAFQFIQQVTLTLPRTVVHVADSLSWNRGSHFLRFGAEGRHIQEIRRTNNFLDGGYAFTGQFSGIGISDFLLGRPATFTQAANIVEGLARNFQPAAFVQDDWKIAPRLTLNLGLRYEPFFPIVDQRDRQTAFRPGQQSTVFPLAPAGLVFAGDKGIPRGLINNQYNRWAPRFGFAWDPFGTGRTSIRGGYGIFWDHVLLQNNIGFNTVPFLLQYNINAPASFANPYGALVPTIPYYPPTDPSRRATTPIPVPQAISSMDAGFRNPYVQQWNLTIEREVVRHWKASASYVGAKGTHLSVTNELNPAAFRTGATAGNIDARRPYAPAFQGISDLSSGATSIYHALQVSVTRRYARGFTLQASYNYGKGIDTISNSSSNRVNSAIQNPSNLRGERGPSDFDITHGFVSSAIWELPWFRKASVLPRTVLGGWQISTIVTARSGRATNVLTGRDTSLTGVGRDRPNVAGDPGLPGGRSHQQQIDAWFNRAAFVEAATGSFGNAGRNVLRTPGLRNVDLGLVKNVQLREGLDWQLRMESFNAFNNVNFGDPVITLISPNFGRLTSALSSRVWQAALKIRF